jgi:cell division septation protein DedD
MGLDDAANYVEPLRGEGRQRLVEISAPDQGQLHIIRPST